LRNISIGKRDSVAKNTMRIGTSMAA